MNDALPLVSVMAVIAMLNRSKNKNRTPEELGRLRLREAELEDQRKVAQAKHDAEQKEEMERAPRAYRRRMQKALSQSKGEQS